MCFALQSCCTFLSAERLCSSVKRVLKPDAIRIRHLKVDRHYICFFSPPIRVRYFVYIFCFPPALAFLTQSRSGRDALCHAAYGDKSGCRRGRSVTGSLRMCPQAKSSSLFCETRARELLNLLFGNLIGVATSDCHKCKAFVIYRPVAMDGKRVGGAGAKAHGALHRDDCLRHQHCRRRLRVLLLRTKPQTQSRLQALLPLVLSLLRPCIGGCCMYRAFAPTQNQHKL